MNKKVFLIVFLLFVLSFLYLYSSDLVYNSNSQRVSTVDLVNYEEQSPQRLFLTNWRIIKNNYYDPTLNFQNWSRWKKRYSDVVKTPEDAYVAINTMLASLDDPYSKYMSKQEYSEQTSNINSKISGIGVNITNISGKTYIISIIEGTPAFKSGLKSGDIILKIDDKDINGVLLSDVAAMIRGEAGSRVVIEVLRDKKKFTKTIIREEIKIKDVKSKLLKNKIEYIQIMSFIGNDMMQEFTESFNNSDNIKAYILDLRGNGGGLLPNAIELSDMFLSEGRIVSIVDRNGIKTNVSAKKDTEITKKPIIILVDKGTASASEIFSGALQDSKRAVLVGERTFGKGMIQKIFPMPNETGLNLTIAKYLTPNGTDINKHGIVPDYKIELTNDSIVKNKDVQLDKAVELAEQAINAQEKLRN